MFITRGINEKLAIAVLVLVAFCTPSPAQNRQCAAAAGENVHVAAVDIHLEPRLEDGRKLRLRGVEPPRGTPLNPQLAEQARAFLAAKLEGRQVAASLAVAEPDRWGRRLADLATGEASTAAGDLIAGGWARVDPLDADAACLPVLFRLEVEARRARRGLWGDPAYAVLDAADSAAFAAHGGRIVVAEGIVAGVAKWRTLTFINFGKGRRGEVSAALSRRVAAALEQRGAPQKGTHLRVRGLLRPGASPRIEVFSADAVELLALPSRE